MRWTKADAYPLFALMALVQLGSAALIYAIVERSRAVRSGISAEGVGCALIWLFCPFSISGTFHHFSYLLLPYLLLFAYIYLTEAAQDWGNRSWYHGVSAAIILAACLTGETVIPPLLVYMAIKVFQRARWRTAVAHGALVLAALAAHYLLLRAHRPQGMSGQRFKTGALDVDVVWASLQQFGASVLSAVQQGLQLTAVSFEPYYTGMYVHAFAWQHLSAAYFAVALLIVLLVSVVLYRPFLAREVPASRLGRGYSKGGFLLGAALVTAASWSLYLVMTIAGARLYSSTFVLQYRYGYAVLPLTGVLLFLLLRRLRGPAGARLSLIAWLIPLGAIAAWLATQMVANPVGAVETRRVFGELAQAKKDGLVVVGRVEQNWSGGQHVRPYGLMNPFVKVGETPLQQDWTTATYLLDVLGLEVADPPFIQWDNESALLIQRGEAMLIPQSGKYARAIVQAAGPEQTGYPHGDPTFVYGKIQDVLQPGTLNLLGATAEIGPVLQLRRIIKAAPLDGPATFVFVWNDAKSSDQVFIHFVDANGTMVYQADHPYNSTLRLQPNGGSEAVRVRAVEVPRDAAKRVARISVGAYTNSSADGHGVSLPVGLEP